MPTPIALLIALLASASPALAAAQEAARLAGEAGAPHFAGAPTEGGALASQDDDEFEEAPAPGQRPPWFVGGAIGYPDGALQVFGSSRSLNEYMGASPTRLALGFEVGRQLLSKVRASAEVLWLRAAATRSGVSASVQLVHFGAAAAFFPFDRGPFVRAGLGYGRLAFDTRGDAYHQADSLGGFGLVGGIGYALALGPVDVFLRIDGSRHWTGAGRLGVDAATFWAGYLGVLYFF